MNLKSVHMVYYLENEIKRVDFHSINTIENEDVKINCRLHDKLFIVEMAAKKKLVLKSFRIEAKANIKERKMFANGYQAWTESLELAKNNRMKKLVVPVMTAYGDYAFYKYTGKAGDLHSYTFTYFYRRSSNTLFLGSVDEHSGYTIFQSKLHENKLIIHKECEGLKLTGTCELVKVFISEGDERDLWNDYLSRFSGNREKAAKYTGWTSWYNYYTHISEPIILHNLQAMKNENIPIDIFQIDDGYQESVGDWLHINKKFPNGMGYLAEQINEAGYRPGIWLAPFICERKSRIFREHKDWILCDKRGHLVVAGWNASWSGDFYALDFYHEGVREYLQQVFQVILKQWGFMMVKLDFLYAVSILPRQGKPRAQIMIEAMEFLNKLTEGHWILGCGVPLAPAFKRVDYCRIGSDVAPFWESQELKCLRYRERISTFGSLHNTLSRYRLNDKVFCNDPDVFILRRNNNRLKQEQKYTLFFLNNLLGGLVFTSDDISDYDAVLMRTFKSMFPVITPDIQYIKNNRDIYQVFFTIDKHQYIAYTNMNKTGCRVYLPQGRYFYEKEVILEGGKEIELKPFETKCFCRILLKEDIILGTTGHLFSRAEIQAVQVQNGKLAIQLKQGFINYTTLYINPGMNIKKVEINNKDCKIRPGYQYLEVSFKSYHSSG